MRRIVLTFGLIVGAVLSVMLLLSTAFMDQIGFDRGMIVGYASMVAAFLMIYFGIRSYRDTVLGGTIRFWPAFRVGLLIMLVGAVCYTATWQFVFYRLQPDFVDKMATYEIDKATKAGASAAVIEAKRREMQEFGELYRKPLVNIGFTMLEPTPVGILISLISAIALSRKRREELSPAGIGVS